MVIDSKEEHLLKAYSSIISRLDGRIIGFSDLQAPKAVFPIFVSPSGKLILTNDVHSLKARSPISLIVLGKVTLVICVFQANALSPIEVIGRSLKLEGTTMDPEALVQSVREYSAPSIKVYVWALTRLHSAIKHEYNDNFNITK
tara:strand:- start:338 stop:769 length:432 start_codon:yes stop_codon:yes gene_type:complete